MRNFPFRRKRDKFMEDFTMDNVPFIIGKIFNNSEYAENLLDGKIFINPLAVFGAGELWKPNINGNKMKSKKFNKYRDDLNEGLIQNINSDNP